MIGYSLGIYSSHRRRIVVLALGILVSIPLSAIVLTSADSRAQNPDNRELIANAERLVAAWNRSDAEVIVALFLPEAVLIMPTGNVARSRSAIRQRLLSEWSGKLKDSKLTHAVESVALLNRDTAVVGGRYRLNGVKILGFEQSPEGSFVFIHKKQQGRWLISKAELQRDRAE